MYALCIWQHFIACNFGLSSMWLGGEFSVSTSHPLIASIMLPEEELPGPIITHKPISNGNFSPQCMHIIYFFLPLVILTRKTWAHYWNWGHLQGAPAAGDTAARSLHWSHPCSQCPWSSHSNLSHPSLASAPQDTAGRERDTGGKKETGGGGRGDEEREGEEEGID